MPITFVKISSELDFWELYSLPVAETSTIETRNTENASDKLLLDAPILNC